MNSSTKTILRGLVAAGVMFLIVGGPYLIEIAGQRQRSTTTTRSTSGTRSGGTTAARSTTTRTTTTRTTTTSGAYRGGTVVHGEEGYAAVGRRGAVVANEEGAAAVGRYGNVVVAGEEGYAARGRYGNVVVGETYESHDAWRVAAGVTRTAIAVGTMLAAPPTGATTVVVTGTTYWVHQSTYYRRVYSGGVVRYQVVARPL